MVVAIDVSHGRSPSLQIRGLRLDEATVSAIVAALVQPDHAIVPIDGGRIERRRRELAFDVGAGRMNERAFLAAMRRLNQEHAALSEDLPRTSIDVGTAVEYIRPSPQAGRRQSRQRGRR